MVPPHGNLRDRRPYAGPATDHRHLCLCHADVGPGTGPRLGDLGLHHRPAPALYIRFRDQMDLQSRNGRAAPQLQAGHGQLCGPCGDALHRRFRPRDHHDQDRSGRPPRPGAAHSFRKEEREHPPGLHAGDRPLLHVHQQHGHDGHDAHLPHACVQAASRGRKGPDRHGAEHPYRRQPGRYGNAHRHSPQHHRPEVPERPRRPESGHRFRSMDAVHGPAGDRTDSDCLVPAQEDLPVLMARKPPWSSSPCSSPSSSG